MNKIKAILMTLSVACFALLPVFGYAQVALGEDLIGTGGVACGVENQDASGNCSVQAGGTSVSSLVKKVINILSWIVGVVSVVMIIIAGFKYVTSGGNDSSVASAKNTILYAVVGLVIVAMAQVIVRFVLTNLDTGGTTGP